jgi:hypothetical protein
MGSQKKLASDTEVLVTGKYAVNSSRNAVLHFGSFFVNLKILNIFAAS